MKVLKKSLLLFAFNSFQFQAHSFEPVVIEFNPMLMINQGLGLNLEIGLVKNISNGVSFEMYKQKVYSNNSINASRTIYSGSYFLRYYFFSEKIGGPFLSSKITMTQSEINLSDYDLTVNSNINYCTGSVSVGYRFIWDSNLTVSAYMGGGIKNKTNYIDKKNLPLVKSANPDWNNAIDEINKQEGKYLADFGLTIGYIF